MNFTNKTAILSNPLINEYFDNYHIGIESAIGFIDTIINKYFPRKNIYHSGKYHIYPMLEYFSFTPLINDDDVENQFVGYFFALFHDATTNVTECQKILNTHININASDKFRRLFDMVHEAIRSSNYTFEHLDSLDSHIQHCIKADIANLNTTDIKYIEKQERLLFKEYASVEYTQYIRNRLNVLEMIYKICDIHEDCFSVRKNFLLNWTPNIGVYNGSFNPFHIGNMDILEQAEKHFDKVIIAVENSNKVVKDVLKYHQVESYTSLIEYIKSKPYHLTLVRGIHNTHDMQIEQDMRTTLQDIEKDVDVIYFMCNNHVSHITSDICQKLFKFDNDLYKKYTTIKEYENNY